MAHLEARLRVEMRGHEPAVRSGPTAQDDFESQLSRAEHARHKNSIARERGIASDAAARLDLAKDREVQCHGCVSRRASRRVAPGEC